MTRNTERAGQRWTELGLALMVLIWGVNFAVVKRALESFEPLGFNALRFLIASVFVLLVLRAQGPLRWPARADLPRVLLLGVLGNGIYQMAFVLGINLTQAGLASLILALAPLFTALLSALSGHERPGALTWVGALVSLSGVALVSGAGVPTGAGSGVLLGNLVLLGAAALWALYTVGARPLTERYGSVPTTAWTLWAGAVPLVLAGVPSLARQPWAAVGAGAWGGLAFSALLSIGLAYLIWYRGVERIGNTRTAIYSNLTPVVALCVATLWLKEPLSRFAIIGAVLTLGGVLLVRADPGAAKSAAEVPLPAE
jgi:drug/metabolite transporter (DMT)-like permease